MKRPLVVAALLCAIAATAAAHGKKHDTEKSDVPANLDLVENAFGKTGDPNAVSRTILVTMGDDMRFEPDNVVATIGETIRFVVRNDGYQIHEMVIGRAEDNREHAVMMKKFPNMEHSEPYMAHASEGQTAEIIWTFSRPGEFEFACLVGDHYERGMKGTITVK